MVQTSPEKDAFQATVTVSLRQPFGMQYNDRQGTRKKPPESLSDRQVAGGAGGTGRQMREGGSIAKGKRPDSRFQTEASQEPLSLGTRVDQPVMWC
jgi:hypothetical protein